MTVNGNLRKICYATFVFDWNKWLNNKAEENTDLSRIGISQIAPFVVTKSRTQLTETTPLG